MQTSLIIIFFISVIMYFIHNKTYEKPPIVIVLIFFFALLLIATFRSIGMPDAIQYKGAVTSSFFSDRYEVGFVYLLNFIRSNTNNFRWLFFAAALLSMTFKFAYMRKYAPFFWGSMVVYISNLFILHDMIQIRASIAAGISLWTIQYIYERDFKRFLTFATLAFCFHNSSLIFILLWFLPLVHIKRNLWLTLIPISYILALAGVTITKFIALIPVDVVQRMFAEYTARFDSGIGTEFNLFNMLLIGRMLVCSYFIFNIDKIEKKIPISRFWLMIYTISIMLSVLLSDMTELSFRISEILQVVEIVLFPANVLLFNRNITGKLITISYSIILLFYSMAIYRV